MYRNQILLEEWKEVRESLRYYGNKRFAQLTVFIAVTGFMVDAFFAKSARAVILLPVAGMILSILFLLIERGEVKYWKAFASRGREIEHVLTDLRLMHRRPQWRGVRKLLEPTCPIYGIYIISLILWVCLFLLRFLGKL